MKVDYHTEETVGIYGSFSIWKDATRIIILISRLFTIYIADLEEGAECKLSKFDNGMKIIGREFSE